jgi:hypothetical protein
VRAARAELEWAKEVLRAQALYLDAVKAAQRAAEAKAIDDEIDAVLASISSVPKAQTICPTPLDGLDIFLGISM